MSSFSDISQETQAILDRIDSSMPPSRIEQLWDCISVWCACGNSEMLSHFLEMVFWKLFQEYDKNPFPYQFDLFPMYQPLVQNNDDLFMVDLIVFRHCVIPSRLEEKLQQLQQRLQQQRQQLHPQSQQPWLQPQGVQHLPQPQHQQQGEPPQPMEELLILACQVLTSLPEDDTLMGHLVDGIMYAMRIGVPIEKAVSYLSTERLNCVCRALEMNFGLFSPATVYLKTTARERSLQDLCVPSTLEAVKGDARKVWSLSELPEPLKELFHVPFLGLYNKLKQ